MDTTAILASKTRDVKTTLNYCVPFDSMPLYKYIYDPPPGVPRKNFSFEAQPVVIRDVRGTDMEKNASLDVEGFQFVSHVNEKEFTDENMIQIGYYKEVEEMLMKLLPGAKRVFIFDYTVRCVIGINSTYSQLIFRDRRLEVDPVNTSNGRGPAVRAPLLKPFLYLL
jgi:hypothetical protein